MPTILHGYTISEEEFTQLGRHIVDDEFYETYMDDDEEPPYDAPTPLEMYFYYLHGLSKEDRAKAPLLFPIHLTPREKIEYERQLEENEATAVSPQRYLLVTHRSKLEPGGKVREAAAVESEGAKKMLDDFVALVLPNAPHVLSAKDFKLTGVPFVNPLAEVMTDCYYRVRMPTILHGYTLGEEEFYRLGRHLIDDKFYKTFMVEGPVDEDTDEDTDEDMDEATPLDMYFYYIGGLPMEERARAPRLFPIDLTPKEETEYERQLEDNEATAVSPQRYLLVTHRSKLEPSGKVRKAACVESERAKKILDDFVALVVPDAPNVLSAKDFKWAHVPRSSVICGSGDLLDHFPFIR
ncbi:hypothetical protein FISHEDRAFT_78818 [Fistulina hepatica ATCC 64428]|uniref:Uncharacterized protein n=1 Tax=Fistulina hepatica ATCC 64428 TaxID=1128425 RepID=A0A0D7A062_9AGAR|nr:hypothetical protein FISHEDRAFT_78818 [Fistulina hepatica ATCC 64428]